MNFSEAYNYTLKSIEPIYEEDEAKAIAQYIFKENYNASALIYLSDVEFNFMEELEHIIEKLQTGEPLQYVLGYTYFGGLKIIVNNDVLIPRPETEELVEIAKEFILFDNLHIADICTGSGCIALAIRKQFPKNRITATDISPEALNIAEANEMLNFGKPSIQFELQDILKMQWSFETPDIVICNPPYIAQSEAEDMAENVLKHEPHLALFVEHEDALLFYKAVIQTFLPYKFPVICFEMNPLYCNKFKYFCENHELTCEIRKDMQGKERFAIVSKS